MVMKKTSTYHPCFVGSSKKLNSSHYHLSNCIQNEASTFFVLKLIIRISYFKLIKILIRCRNRTLLWLTLNIKQSRKNNSIPSGKKNRRDGRPKGKKTPSDSSFLKDSMSFCCKWCEVWCLETEGNSIGVTSTPWPWDRVWWLQILWLCCVEFNRNRFMKEFPIRIRSLDAIIKCTSSLNPRGEISEGGFLLPFFRF